MTFRFQTNIINSGYDGALVYDFKEFMKLSSPNGPGWAIPISSDGTTFGAGDNIGSAAEMVNGSWFVLQDPAGNRELMIQRSSSNEFMIMYSASDGFSGGGATTRPTSTDEQAIHTNSSVTSGRAFYDGGSEVISHFGANDSDGYAFYIISYRVSTSSLAAGGVLFMDELVSGSYQDGYETDPVVFYAGIPNSTSNLSYIYMGNSNTVLGDDRCSGWAYKDTAEEEYTVFNALHYRYEGTTNLTSPIYTPQDRITRKHFIFPIVYCMQSLCYKGIGKYFKWAPYESVAGSVFTGNSTRDYIVCGNVIFPWNGTTPQS